MMLYIVEASYYRRTLCFIFSLRPYIIAIWIGLRREGEKASTGHDKHQCLSLIVHPTFRIFQKSGIKPV